MTYPFSNYKNSDTHNYFFENTNLSEFLCDNKYNDSFQFINEDTTKSEHFHENFEENYNSFYNHFNNNKDDLDLELQPHFTETELKASENASRIANSSEIEVEKELPSVIPFISHITEDNLEDYVKREVEEHNLNTVVENCLFEHNSKEANKSRKSINKKHKKSKKQL